MIDTDCTSPVEDGRRDSEGRIIDNSSSCLRKRDCSALALEMASAVALIVGKLAGLMDAAWVASSRLLATLADVPTARVAPANRKNCNGR